MIYVCIVKTNEETYQKNNSKRYILKCICKPEMTLPKKVHDDEKNTIDRKISGTLYFRQTRRTSSTETKK